MKELITIKNFGVIKEAQVSLTSINIFIGKQASGKSITAKLIYFFKKIFPAIFESLSEGKSKREFDREILHKFESYFPIEYWENDEFVIQYEINGENITLIKENHKKLKISYSDRILKLFNDSKRILKKYPVDDEEEVLFRYPYTQVESYYDHLINAFGTTVANQFFIPAGRSFFANLQSTIYTFLSRNKELDPFLVEFGTFYNNMKGFVERRFRRNGEGAKEDRGVDKLIREVLCGRYIREKERDYILHEDNRKVDLSFSSSGQQEILPLIVILKAITKIGFLGNGATIYIEEPEAHLFPSAQKKIVELIAMVYNISNSKLQFVITTHSPYILTSFNNLLEASSLNERKGINKKKLNEIVPSSEMIDPAGLNAQAFRNNQVVNLMDKETGLISAEILDQVSEDIAVQFDELLSLS